MVNWKTNSINLADVLIFYQGQTYLYFIFKIKNKDRQPWNRILAKKDKMLGNIRITPWTA